MQLERVHLWKGIWLSFWKCPDGGATTSVIPHPFLFVLDGFGWNERSGNLNIHIFSNLWFYQDPWFFRTRFHEVIQIRINRELKKKLNSFLQHSANCSELLWINCYKWKTYHSWGEFSLIGNGVPYRTKLCYNIRNNTKQISYKLKREGY